MTVALTETMKQEFAWRGDAKNKIRTRHIPVITVLNIRMQKQEKASHKHHSIREIGGYTLPRSFVFPKNEAERSEGAKEYARNANEGVKTMAKDRTYVTNWCRKITTVIINAASKVFKRATRPKGNSASEYVTRPQSRDEDRVRNGLKMAMENGKHEKKGPRPTWAGSEERLWELYAKGREKIPAP